MVNFTLGRANQDPLLKNYGELCEKSVIVFSKEEFKALPIILRRSLRFKGEEVGRGSPALITPGGYLSDLFVEIHRLGFRRRPQLTYFLTDYVKTKESITLTVGGYGYPP